MDAQQRLRDAIELQETRLRANVPADRVAASIAVVEAIDRRQVQFGVGEEPTPNVVTGRRFASYGGSKAIQFCLEAAEGPADLVKPAVSPDLAGWADQFLIRCDHLATANSVLGHVESGFMRLTDDGNATLAAWRATKLTPASWRERADIDWWAASLARTIDTDPTGRSPAQPEREARGRSLSIDPLDAMAYQIGYPPSAVIDGCSVQTYCDVLRNLISRLGTDSTSAKPTSVWSKRVLVASIAKTIDVDPTTVQMAVSAYAVDAETAAWHASVPGVASAPLVRVAPDLLVGSRRGLATEPLFFLGRELRRRAPKEYHNAARHRETAFREDLYRLFNDRRFVTSTGRIELRRDRGGIRTDIDAVVFDRRTGTLGLFELKSQDPFSRSAEELARRRDNLLYANGQVSRILDWMNRYGADEILRRVDAQVAKTFRVQKVYPFVLARYLVRFDDGPTPDHRLAWATWPEVLRQVDVSTRRPGAANPIASLFKYLRAETITGPKPDPGSRQELQIGDVRLVVHASRDAWREATPGNERSAPG